ncbi:hypothetical protein H6P87_00905 [Rickettsia tillamookensis]|uniref:Uncharacterized protein n=1 Tax=Rickettsia tillamookensis TaxID=2761623 RepID=A0A9E6MI17_9RICK|nr:hypothetical protein H6P87_00905 [Rickettsia tillamookensis]
MSFQRGIVAWISESSLRGKTGFVAWLKKPARCHTVACPRYPVKQLKILIILVFLTRSRE